MFPLLKKDGLSLAYVGLLLLWAALLIVCLVYRLAGRKDKESGASGKQGRLVVRE